MYFNVDNDCELVDSPTDGLCKTFLRLQPNCQHRLWTKFPTTVQIDEARTHVVCTMIDDVMLALLCRQNRLVRRVLGRLTTSWAYNSHLNFSQSESYTTFDRAFLITEKWQSNDESSCNLDIYQIIQRTKDFLYYFWTCFWRRCSLQNNQWISFNSMIHNYISSQFWDLY